MQSENYVRIDEDLDEGKKCCLCCRLEDGYNVIGLLSLIGAILNIFIFVAII